MGSGMHFQTRMHTRIPFKQYAASSPPNIESNPDTIQLPAVHTFHSTYSMHMVVAMHSCDIYPDPRASDTRRSDSMAGRQVDLEGRWPRSESGLA